MQPTIRWYIHRHQVPLSELFERAWSSTRSYKHDIAADVALYRRVGAVPPYVNEFLRSPAALRRQPSYVPYW